MAKRLTACHSRVGSSCLALVAFAAVLAYKTAYELFLFDEKPPLPDAAKVVRFVDEAPRSPVARRATPNHSSPAVAMTRHADDQLIFLSTVDEHYIDVALNLYLSSYARFNVTNYLFLATDDKTCPALTGLGLSCFHYLDIGNSKEASVYGSADFNRKSYVRPQAALEGLKAGLTVAIVDLDIVFLRNPVAHLTCPDCDLLYQLERAPNTMNGGLYVVRPTKAGIALQERSLARMLASGAAEGDQVFFNGMLSKMRAKREIRDRPLDPVMFPNGRRFFEEGHRMFKDDNPCWACVAIHNNFVVSLEAKRYRFKELGLWLVDTDGYYSSQERKYIQYRNPLDFGRRTTAEMELEALGAAFLIARVLNRTVILPRFHCYGVKGYKPTPGQLCSFAALYNVRLLDRFTADYRENVFLESDLVPDVVKRSLSDTFLVDSEVWRRHPAAQTNVTVLRPRGEKVSLSELKQWFDSESSSVLRLHSLYIELDEMDDASLTFISRFRKAIRRIDFRQFKELRV